MSPGHSTFEFRTSDLPLSRPCHGFVTALSRQNFKKSPVKPCLSRRHGSTGGYYPPNDLPLAHALTRSPLRPSRTLREAPPDRRFKHPLTLLNTTIHSLTPPPRPRRSLMRSKLNQGKSSLIKPNQGSKSFSLGPPPSRPLPCVRLPSPCLHPIPLNLTYYGVISLKFLAFIRAHPALTARQPAT